MVPRVLLVEESEPLREVLEWYCAAWGYEASAVSTIEEARQRLTQEKSFSMAVVNMHKPREQRGLPAYCQTDEGLPQGAAQDSLPARSDAHAAAGGLPNREMASDRDGTYSAWSTTRRGELCRSARGAPTLARLTLRQVRRARPPMARGARGRAARLGGAASSRRSSTRRSR